MPRQFRREGLSGTGPDVTNFRQLPELAWRGRALNPGGNNYYVSGDGGSDSDDGLSPLTPKATIGSAITAVEALPVGDASPAAIHLSGGEVYAEDITLPAFTTLHGEDSTLTGKITLKDYSAARLYRHRCSSGATVSKSSTGPSFYSADYVAISGTATGIQCSAGQLYLEVGELSNLGAGAGLGDATAQTGILHGHVHRITCNGKDAISWGTSGSAHLTLGLLSGSLGTGVKMAGSSTAVLNLRAGVITGFTNAWNVGSGATLRGWYTHRTGGVVSSGTVEMYSSGLLAANLERRYGAWQNGSTYTLTGGFANVTLDTQIENSDATNHFTLASNEVTVKKGGIYWVGYSVATNKSVSAGLVEARFILQQNGSNVSGTARECTVDTLGDGNSVSCYLPLTLATNDTLRVQGRIMNGSNFEVPGNRYILSIMRIPTA